MSIDLNKLRNIGIIAHIDAGKTTVTERMLFYSGGSHILGNVDDGNTTTDWMDQERERGITIVSAAITFPWKDHNLNLIDTPGHVDFTAEVERSLRVLDGVVAVFCGVAGVQAQSETVWRQADRYHVPRLSFINKLDRVGADFQRAAEQIRTRLGGNPVPIELPLGLEDQHIGVIDLVTMREIEFDAETRGAKFDVREIREDLRDEAEEARHSMVEALADADDEFAELFLAESFSEDDLRQAIRRATIDCKITPVLCGSAFTNIGVQPLLDAVLDYLPAPHDLPPPKGLRPDSDEEIQVKPKPSDPFSALAFKTVSDKYGDLTYLRIYSGKIKSNATIYNASKGRKERLSRLYRMRANSRIALEEASAGDIVAVVGLKFTSTGDTLCEQHKQLVFEKPVFPDTVVSLAIEPKSNEDKDRLGDALQKLSREDPTFRAYFDNETGQQVISGMGELHLEVLLRRMVDEFNVRANVGEPRVSYRETIGGPARYEARFIKQTGGRGQYAVVELEVEPFENEEDGHLVIENEIRGGAIPTNYIPAVMQGVREAASTGARYDYPVIHAKVRIVDGKFHEVDSSEIAFEMAGAMAFREACQKAGVLLLEPYMSVEVSAPPEYQGNVLGDLNSRRALVTGTDIQEHLVTIKALVPLAEMFGYASDLRTITSGRADYAMEPAEFREIPKQHYQRFDSLVAAR